MALLADLYVEHDGSLKDIVKQTQALWLRSKGQERWQMSDRFQGLQEKVWPYFKEMGLLNSQNPLKSHYNYALVFGANYKSVKERISFLIDQWQRGIRFDQIILLGAERQLDNSIECMDDLVGAAAKKPATETEMMRLLWSQMQIPPEMKALPLIIVDTPMKKGEEAGLIRPNTGDTINYWLLYQNPIAGTVLAISHQPYVQYQDSVLRTLIPQNFIVETVGFASDEESTAVHLDNIARILYQEQQRLNSVCTAERSS